MQISTVCKHIPTSIYTDPSNIGFSEISKTITKNHRDAFTNFFYEPIPITIVQGAKKTIEILNEIYEECSKEDWDGYGANPISFDAIQEAKRFIQLLPYKLPQPEVVPEPTGEVGLEWYKDKDSTFVISFNGRKTLAYAGIFGSKKIHGTTYFEDLIPLIIYEEIKKLIPKNQDKETSLTIFYWASFKQTTANFFKMLKRI